MPQLDSAIVVALISVTASGIGGLWFFLRTHRKAAIEKEVARQSALAERFDDASHLAEYIRAEVERQVQPIRDELKRVTAESHEMRDAVRAHFTQLWFWDQRGRLGQLPMLPAPILIRLGLGHLLEEPFGDTEPATPRKDNP